MGGTWATPTVKTLIIKTMHDMEQKGQKPEGELVRETVIKQLRKMGKSSLDVPKVRRIQQIMKENRGKREALSDKEKGKDQPWSIITLVDYPIPPEALPAVMKVWKYCMAQEEIFTIRMAYWVVRLHALVEDTFSLYFFSMIYIWKELACKYIGESTDSTQIDLTLVYPQWVSQTAKWVGRPAGDAINIPVVGWEMDSTSIKMPLPELEIGSTAINWIGLQLEVNGVQDLNPDQKAVYSKLLLELPVFGKLSMTEDTKLVYSYWLKHLYKGPNWKKLSPEKRLETIERLREWVQSCPANCTGPLPEDSLSQTRNIMLERLRDRSDIVIPENQSAEAFLDAKMSDNELSEFLIDASISIPPTELLNEVGYDASKYSTDLQQ